MIGGKKICVIWEKSHGLAKRGGVPSSQKYSVLTIVGILVLGGLHLYHQFKKKYDPLYKLSNAPKQRLDNMGAQYTGTKDKDSLAYLLWNIVMFPFYALASISSELMQSFFSSVFGVIFWFFKQ